MDQLFRIGVTCQVEGLLKTLRVEDDPPIGLIDAVQDSLVYPNRLNRTQVKILTAKINKMDKYLKKHNNMMSILNYILAIAEDAELTIKPIFELYKHYDPDLQATEEMAHGSKLARKWESICKL